MSSMMRKAQRQQAKLRIGFSGPSGSGKTMTALLIAKGLCKGDMSKICVIDTENNSADLYSHLGEYNVIPLSAPYTPEKYIKAISECEEAGIEACIIDSITHEWKGAGGILEIHGAMSGNSFANWAIVTPRHDKFINHILQSKMHILTTVRTKTDYVMELNDKGKQAPVKVGLKEETREGFEYELTLNFNIDQNSQATQSKDRTGLFHGQHPRVLSDVDGAALLEWSESGVAPIPVTVEVDIYEKVLNDSKDLKALSAAWKSIPGPKQPLYEGLKDTLKATLA